MQRSFPTLLAACALAACSGIQSPLDPHGPAARQTANLAWVLFAGGAVIFTLVIVLAACAMLLRPERCEWLARSSLIVGGGIVFPIITLSALLVYDFMSAEGRAGAKPQPLRIEIVGEMWWWRVHYLDAGGGRQFATANEIRIPVGTTVELTLKSADVIHSFWLPSLAGKLDMIPGRANKLRISADQPGIFRGQCGEYCGAQHAKMALYVVALEPQAFDAWLASEIMPAREPRVPGVARGKALFLTHCATCHTVRGTVAAGTPGPDLTHVGSRLSLAAGILPNNAGTLAAWIAASQQLKPENRMPSFGGFTGEELVALAAYLESLQ